MSGLKDDIMKLTPFGAARNKAFPGPSKQKSPPGFTAMEKPMGNRPKNRKYPSKARTPLGG